MYSGWQRGPLRVPNPSETAVAASAVFGFLTPAACAFLCCSPSLCLQLFDKDAASFQGLLEVLRERIRSPEAQSMYRDVGALMNPYHAGVSPSLLERMKPLACAVLDSMPQYVSPGGKANSPEYLPLLPCDLAEKYPEAWAELLHAAHADSVATGAAAEGAGAGSGSAAAPSAPGASGWRESSLFHPGVEAAYRPILPALVREAQDRLLRCVYALRDASHAGAWNLAAGQLLCIEALAHPKAVLHTFLNQYCLHFSLLCEFHTMQAVQRKAQACI